MAATGRSHIGVRDLRANVAQFVRRAGRGERIVVTVDGVALAQLGPLDPGSDGPTLDDLVRAGLADPPASLDRPAPPDPFPVPIDLPVADVLEARRGR